jgi:hypothetical protein
MGSNLRDSLGAQILNSRRDDFSKYKGKSVEFIEDTFGVTLVPDVIELCRAVDKYEVVEAKSGNATGKTHIAAHLAYYWLLCFPTPTVWTTAAPPESNLRNLLWKEINAIHEKNKDNVLKGVKRKDLRIELDVERFIEGTLIPQNADEHLQETRFSGKHSPTLAFIIDEANGVPRPVFKGIESCLSSEYIRLLCLFNPRSPSGYTYTMELERQCHIVCLTAFNHPNVRTGKNIIDGAVSRKVTLQRIDAWTRHLRPGETSEDADVFEVPEFLVGTTVRRKNGTMTEPLKAGYRKIEDTQFKYMVLAEYPDESVERLIQDRWINDARTRWDLYVDAKGESPSRRWCIYGQDVAEKGGDWNVGYARYGGFVARAVKWRGLDLDATAERARKTHMKVNARWTFADGTGVGAGIAPYLQRRGVNAIGVRVANRPTAFCERGEFFMMRDQLYWHLREWLQHDPTAMLPPDEELIQELRVPEFGHKNGKIYVMSKDDMRDELGRSPDHLDALALTFYPEPDASPVMTTTTVERVFNRNRNGALNYG